MPYRAMFATIVTVAFALLALGMWISVIEPVLVGAEKADAVSTAPAARSVSPSATSAADVPESVKVRWVMQGTLILAFVLICLLLIVGFGATFREWVRYGSRQSLRRAEKTKTAYVDAWKLAGERMQVEGTADEDGEEESDPG
jgi:hypothetical protein